MSKNLLILESPNKIKTISGYLGNDFRVMSSNGHIRDIEALGKNSIGIDFNNNYAPNYVIDSSKEELVRSLREAAKKADMVWLASDPDREGEAIAWHLQQVLGLDDSNSCRVTFESLVEDVVQDGIKHPRQINHNLVNAQQARRVMDRIVGFELSPVLWKKVTTGLSAGRVQSVVARLVVEREREIEDFEPTASYRLTAEFVGKTTQGEDASFKAELNHRFATKEEALAFLESCKSATYEVSSVGHKINHRCPAPPFTTSTLQQEASRKLHFSASKTMRLAQSLFEAGHITYMRTDSVTLSSMAIGAAKNAIVSEFGENYHKARQFQTKSKGAQEAHEAIRPAYINKATAGANNDERRLYDLIRKRTIASQMADAQTDTTRVEVTMNDVPYLWVATHEVVTFDGFMRVYTQAADEELTNAQAAIALLQANVDCQLATATAQESFTKPPIRYSEGTLIKKMEEEGIGRPSTYHSMVELIQQRKYAVQTNIPGVKRTYNILTLHKGKITDKEKTEVVGAETGKLVPTDLGRITNDFLVEHFPAILSYDFTAQSEASFDTIASGEANWIETVDTFYQTFHPLIKQVPSGKMAARLVGHHPETGEPILARISKNGPCVQLGDSDTEKPKFASLQKDQSIFTLTLEEALELFRTAFPYTLGAWQEHEIVVGEGKYGPYLRYNNAFISIPKHIDAHYITMDEAVELITKHSQQQLPVHVWGDIQVLNGRYGAYIKTPQGNYKLPRQTNVAELTEEQCRSIIASSNKTKK